MPNTETVYVVINGERSNHCCGVDIIGIYHTWEAALAAAKNISPMINTPDHKQSATWTYEKNMDNPEYRTDCATILQICDVK